MSVRTAHDVLDSDPVPATPSLVWDRASGGAVVSAAEHLAVAGCRVVLVTPSMAVADDVDLTNHVPLYRRLYERSVEMLPNTEVVRIDTEGVVVTNIYTGRETTVSGIERVVVCNAAEACDELADALREGGLPDSTAVAGALSVQDGCSVGACSAKGEHALKRVRDDPRLAIRQTTQVSNDPCTRSMPGQG